MSILEQARAEGRQQQRASNQQITAMQREEIHEEGRREGWFEAQRENKRWNRFYFLLGVSVTVLFFKLVLYP